MHKLNVVALPLTSLLLLAMALLSPSCKDEGVRPTLPRGTNQLTVASVPDEVRLFVVGEAYNKEGFQTCYFTAPLHRMTLSLSGYTAGSVVLRLRDRAGATMRYDSLRSDTTIVCTQSLGTLPYALEYRFSAFSGRLEYSTVQHSRDTTSSVGGFPIHPGCGWRYAVTQSNTPFDTVTVEVLRDTLIPGAAQATVWQFVSGRGSFRGVAIRNADTVSFSFPTEEPFPPFRLVFPLIPGQTWSGPAPLYDWNFITVSEALNLPTGPLNSAFVIEQQWWTLNDRGDVYRWVAPGIGVVQLDYSRVGMMGIIDERWQLISVYVCGPANPM